MLRRTLIAWAESGFNLVPASSRLHIHRNGLLYRLDETERTGRSCRGLTLYLAALSDQLDDPGTRARPGR